MFSLPHSDNAESARCHQRCLLKEQYFANLPHCCAGIVSLKVPKREIFDSSDFPDFYTIKSLRVGDFGVKIKKKFKII